MALKIGRRGKRTTPKPTARGPTAATASAPPRKPSPTASVDWEGLVQQVLAVMPQPQFLLVPIVAQLARDSLGLSFRGRKPPARIASAIEAAIASALAKNLIEETEDSLSIGPAAAPEYQPVPEAEVTSDTGWHHCANSRPMLGWIELERIVEFSRGSPEPNMQAALTRLRDGWQTLMGARGHDEKSEEERLRPERWLLRVWRDHTSIY